ncbi:copper amine oxidase N-terminal domain-containing protein [Saccharibacillus brassicae]|uniref:Copper amine oxidase N-terminal domain-containing protein n=1 Tax=Saccharibacillus brassicae TaxID=2583377 RepID=A0A4Y6USG8_SACBS|nr:copper amine oxidase N-terminal domain-containing protein [Saccharibacillus brassicae]QDH19588.1 copper amine oxidase N-terminal domain-containing protein [Saccharibacillus brassicae]
MKKRTVWIAALAYGLSISSVQAESVMQVSVDGKAVAFRTNPVVQSSVTMVQFAPIFRSLGASFQWNGQKQQVTATRGGTKMILTVGSRVAYVNGSAVRMQQAPAAINGNIFVPLRFVGEATGARVDFAGSRISITSAPLPPSPGDAAAGANSGSAASDSAEIDLTKAEAANTDPNRSPELSEQSIHDYLITHYDTLYTPDTGYEVDYDVQLGDEGDYHVSILLDNYEASGSLYAETRADGSVLYDLTGELATDLSRQFDLEALYVHVTLAPVLEQRPDGVNEEELLELDDGSFVLIRTLFVGMYDFAGKYADFYDVTSAESKFVSAAEW